jgi:hypothetical protein
VGNHSTFAASESRPAPGFETRASGLLVPYIYNKPGPPLRWRQSCRWLRRIGFVIVYMLLLMTVSAETGSILEAFLAIGAFAGALAAQVQVLRRWFADGRLAGGG